MKQQNDKKARREANKPLQASRRARRCSRCKMASLADEGPSVWQLAWLVASGGRRVRQAESLSGAGNEGASS